MVAGLCAGLRVGEDCGPQGILPLQTGRQVKMFVPMALTELNDVLSKVNYRPVILRTAATKNLLVKVQKHRMLRLAQYDRSGDLHVDRWAEDDVALRYTIVSSGIKGSQDHRSKGSRVLSASSAGTRRNSTKVSRRATELAPRAVRSTGLAIKIGGVIEAFEKASAA
jgi:hypothetical protein